MTIPRVGSAATKPLGQWIDSRRYAIHVIHIHSVNHLIEVIEKKQVDYVAIEPTWIPSEWFSPVVGLAAANDISVILLTDYLNPQAWGVAPWPQAKELPTAKHTCLEIDWLQHQVKHQGHLVALPKRVQEFLLLIQIWPHELWTLEKLNGLAQDYGIDPFTKGSLQWIIHTIRSQLGSRHIQRVRQVGYRFHSCDRNSAKNKPEPEVRM